MNIIIAALVALSFLTVVPEEGATFEEGICWEADGTEGIASFDGQCITPADYDALYSHESLAATPVGAAYNGTPLEGKSIAEVYGITPEDDPASDRPIGTGLVEPGTERTFKQRVAAAHSPHMPIAD